MGKNKKIKGHWCLEGFVLQRGALFVETRNA